MEKACISDDKITTDHPPNAFEAEQLPLSKNASFTKDAPCSSESSSNSNEVAVSAECNIEGELDCGSEAAYRTLEEKTKRAVFYMEEDLDPTKCSPTHSVSQVSLFQFEKNIDDRKILVGICAMAKKTNSKPMKEILGRLERFEYLQTIIFDEEVIRSAPVEDWPVVDALISFFSTGFPLQKAIQYKHLRKPFVINDLEAQYSLKDRREVYKILEREGISHPRYAVMNRDEIETGDFVESEDSIEVNGISFQRPFVEKPVCAEDHNVYIYFPVSAGGGCQRLFRKVGSRSSVYSAVNRVRKCGSYIYEDFMPTDGTDVKVYTVGPDYAHAEARKSPALDGKVERDRDGKEIRFPVLLTSAEKLIARKVCLAFKQNVCGFDLLRASGKSYVCDVNGFSFVKNSTKYYDDCANVLGTMIIRTLAPTLHIPLVLGAAPEDIPVVPTTLGSMMELRCVVGVIRHGDRTPKQKMKMEVKHKRFFDLFEKYDGFRKGHLKLKKPKQLQEVLDIARDLLSEKLQSFDPEIQEKKAKLRQLKLVLEMYGHFSGINRKVQLKYQPHGAPKRSSSEEDEYPKEPSLVLILKWGGELTPAGKYQAEDLGKAFRTLYPGGQGEFETPGLGFLRLHSTFRHDLKIYASDEGRVQMTAAAFTKGLLALEGELTPILVSMVKSANTNGLLDKEGETSKYQHVVKERMLEIFNQDKEFSEEDTQKLCPTGSASLMTAIKFIRNPRQMCDRLFQMVQEITARIRTLKLELKSRDLKLYHGESWELLMRRWAKLEKDFKMKDGKFDISKIPDIYDCIKYDLEHNQKILQFDRADELLICSKALADIVIPQEYGITLEEKLHISQSICTPLMRKIHRDLFQGCQVTDDEESTRLNSKYSKGVASPERFVRTRLYFTSESHIHSLLNMLRYGGLCEEMKDEQWKKAMDFLSNTPELNYMTQIVIMMFEDPSQDAGSPERFHVELHFSPGAYTNSDKNVVNPISSGYRTILLTPQVKCVDERKEEGMKAVDVIQEELEEKESQPGINREDTDTDVEESRTLTSIEEMTNKKVLVNCPGSPDPDIPEWDWGDNSQDGKDSNTQQSTTTITESQPDSASRTHSSHSNVDTEQSVNSTTEIVENKCNDTVPVAAENTVSSPIEIKVNPTDDRKLQRAGSFDGKRSRSLEDKEISADHIGEIGHCRKNGRPTTFYPFRYSLSDVFSADHSGDFKEQKTMVEKHYLTIHLPIAKERHYHSFSSLLYLNPEAFKAFDGFNMVPSLKPLETLHNRLTMQDLDKFLSRATTAKFFTPASSPMYSATPIVSPRQTLAQSLPSSSNSSAGPSSPTTATTPVDFMAKVKMYILDTQRRQGESLSESSSQTSNQYPSPSQISGQSPSSQISPNQVAQSVSQDTDKYTSASHVGDQSQSESLVSKQEVTKPCESESSFTTESDIGTSQGSEPLARDQWVSSSRGGSGTKVESRDLQVTTDGHQSAFTTYVPRSSQKSSSSQRSPVFHVTQVKEDALLSVSKRDQTSPSTTNRLLSSSVPGEKECQTETKSGCHETSDK